MHISFSTIFFRLLNTAALFALLGYLFRKYFFESIKRTIAQKELERQILKEQELQLIKSGQAAAQSLELQKKQAEELFQKVMQWQQHVTQDEENARTEQLEAQRKLKKRMHQQKDLIEQMALKRMVAGPAVDQARKSLQATFKNPQAGHQYLQEIMQALAKRNA